MALTEREEAAAFAKTSIETLCPSGGASLSPDGLQNQRGLDNGPYSQRAPTIEPVWSFNSRIGPVMSQ